MSIELEVCEISYSCYWARSLGLRPVLQLMFNEESKEKLIHAASKEVIKNE